jgi:hypothetical protein
MKEISPQETGGSKANLEATEETKNESVMQDDWQEPNWPCKEVQYQTGFSWTWPET